MNLENCSQSTGPSRGKRIAMIAAGVIIILLILCVIVWRMLVFTPSAYQPPAPKDPGRHSESCPRECGLCDCLFAKAVSNYCRTVDARPAAYPAPVPTLESWKRKLETPIPSTPEKVRQLQVAQTMPGRPFACRGLGVYHVALGSGP